MTAELLASGIKIIEKSENMHFDLILCGRESTDYIGGEVGGMLAAGRVAARLGGGSVNDVVKITAEEGIITAIRPVFGGTIRETVQVRAKPAVISIRAGSYDVPENVLEASRRADPH